ncbi:2-succinyl-5-enolpyruvyl-6-hydroxy-3-cyclohexene-1-carboxylic-acid synthase [Mesobacillus foraminis]|uniref:2-succinyl-5-enolpyruvyl-6-hydroxy-3- cyclohexene-1-carboxylic-acid synthase n=1 Tax=Mesobacillus foraminis TaxID=279826 RepID=UPI001BE841E8|nr:2-succinyl-5-enolpyruvyl-6-hydroxy-3-cyclohexene-1-carboxylic-acid synthase [Mesobacillus foraminis]MBT2754350.1 2-succinyl-5-enolpyruvyl-6-hydroxy-3-cyclohexene-1-carboxylic-acid synthase [Mesobacillus foraminis]
MNHQEALTTYIAAFVAELSAAGIEDVVISPGSRSTPIAMVMAEHPDLNLFVHVDERSAAYFALGIAKAKKKPVAVLCTSGTAAANYYPAIIEAGISRIPLIVLTADRPHELRDVGAPQAIDQIHLYGHNVKWFVEMSLPDSREEMIRYSRTVCARAAATAMKYPSGPVHLNFPLREPLIPALDDGLFKLQERTEGFVDIMQGVLTLPDEAIQAMALALTSAKRGIIVAGPLEENGFASSVLKLAELLKFPVLADPLSQLRSCQQDSGLIIDAYDTILRSEEAKAALEPDLIIRFGAMPVSKATTIFIKENPNARQIVIDGGGGWRDPLISASDMVYCDETYLCNALVKHLSPSKSTEYVDIWRDINLHTKEQIKGVRDLTELSEGKLFHLLADMLPKGAALFVGNSMPIRDLDTFFLKNDKEIRVLANRGANGIDGVVSAAMGVATVHQPMYLVLGDLTFFHDLNGLIAAKLFELNITILLVNNNGGGIFSFLPQAEQPKHFEKLFGTPLDLDFSHAVKMYGGTFISVKDWDQYQQAFNETKGQQGLHVIEISTARNRNLTEHRDLWKSVSREIRNLLDDAKNDG